MFKDRFDIRDFLSSLRLDNINIREIPLKYIAIGGAIILSLSGLMLVVFNSKDTKSGVVEVRVRNVNYLDESVVELINEGEKYSNIYHNGEKIEVKEVIPSKGKAMELPKVNGTLDIEKREQVRELTYEASLEESAKYVNFLLKEGYQILREAYTSEYIEFYMTKGTTERRIIILNNIIMVGELDDGWNLPDISNYFK